MKIVKKYLKNIKPSVNDDWLLDNVQSGFMVLGIGILTSMFINLFTSIEKNYWIIISILILVIASYFLLKTLLCRDKLDKQKREIAYTHNELSNPESLEIFKADDVYKEYMPRLKSNLFAYLALFLLGAFSTIYGNMSISEQKDQQQLEFYNRINCLSSRLDLINQDLKTFINGEISKQDDINSKLLDDLTFINGEISKQDDINSKLLDNLAEIILKIDSLNLKTNVSERY